MTERFKQYLEQEFRAIKPTKAAMDLRKATLTKLLEYAQDCRLRGMVDDDAIYHLAIDSLGDFNKTLVEFDRELTDRPKRNAKKLIIVSSIVLAVATVISLYVALSVTGVTPWNKSWLIPVGAILLSSTAGLILLGVKIAIRKSYLIPRACLAVAIILLSTFAFLMIIMLSELPYSYFAFLIMVMAALVSDTAIGLLTKSKFAIMEAALTFTVCCALIFVMLGISAIMPWHPGWLLPTLGGIIALGGLIVLFVYGKSKKKNKVKKSALKPTAVDEKFYTEW